MAKFYFSGHQSGYLMPDKLVVPRRKVSKDWHVGLNTDPVDRSHPDVHDDTLIEDAANARRQMNESTITANSSVSSTAVGSIDSTGTKVILNTSQTETNIQLPINMDNSTGNGSVDSTKTENETNIQVPTIIQLPTNMDNSTGNGSVDSTKTENETTTQLPTNIDNSTGSGSVDNTKTENETTSGRRLLQDTDSKGIQGGSESTVCNNDNDHAATVENDEGLEANADTSFELFRDNDELADEYSYDYDDYVDESLWGDEEWAEDKHENIEDYVDIDSHILCTPVIADIDNDGVSEMVVAVSYYFDHEYYDNPEHLAELGGIDIGKYVAGSIVVFDLDTKQVKWTRELDLSTDTADFRAYIYSSPTVVDLDGDGNLDILVGTSFGLFYVIDHQDINDDGKIELLTTDTHGNVAAWTPQGDELWEVHLKSLVPQRPSVGDVDGDGHTDVVVPTVSGNIYVLNGKDGSFVRPYPYRTHGRVMNQVLLVDLSKRGEKQKGLTLVTTSFDGYLYLIDGPTSCADVVDIGETSYSMVLADNVDGGDDLDLIVTTMNGNVFCFSTPAPHHPLKSWRSSNQGRNNMAYQFNREGIHILPSSRAFRDEEGKNFWLEFEIIDKYRLPSGSQAPYNVTTTLLVPGNYQGERQITQSQVYDSPGKYRMKLPTVPVRTTGTVVLEMVDKNKIHFSDEFSLTFHMHYYKLLKWLMVLPMLGMFALLVILRPQEAVPLPSFSRNTDL